MKNFIPCIKVNSFSRRLSYNLSLVRSVIGIKSKLSILIFLLFKFLLYPIRDLKLYNRVYYKFLPFDVIIRNQDGVFYCRKKTIDIDVIDYRHEEKIRRYFEVEEGCFVDVGAHIGKYTVMVGRKLKEKGGVIAIEPDPDNFRILQKNLELNELENVIALNVAALDKNSEIMFYSSKSASTKDGCIFQERINEYKTIKVKSRRLDDVLQELGVEEVELLKLDVERAEELVLKGMLMYLRNTRCIIYETLDKVADKKCKSLLMSYGFKIYDTEEETMRYAVRDEIKLKKYEKPKISWKRNLGSVLFLHPPNSHPVHKKFAKALYSTPFEIKQSEISIKSVFIMISGLFLPKYDIYFCEDIAALQIAIVKKIYLKNKVILLVATPFFTLIEKKHKILKLIFKLVLSKVDGIITVSELDKKYIEKFFSGPIKIVHPFIKEEVFQELGKTKPNLDSYNIVTVAGMHPQKGIDILIEAFKIVKEKIKDVKLYIIGRGTEKLLDEMESAEGIHVEGYVKKLSQYFQNCSLFVQPSRYDSFPVSTLEALRAGLPTIVTNKVGTKIVIRKLGENFIREVEVGDIAKGILQYFDLNLKEREKISTKAKEISKEFEENKKLEDFRRKFNELMEKIR